MPLLATKYWRSEKREGRERKKDREREKKTKICSNSSIKEDRIKIAINILYWVVIFYNNSQQNKTKQKN